MTCRAPAVISQCAFIPCVCVCTAQAHYTSAKADPADPRAPLYAKLYAYTESARRHPSW